MTKRIYRVRITEYPASLNEWAERMAAGEGLPDWSPDGWEPDEKYLDMFPDGVFRWPSTNRLYRSRSSAVERARLIETYGASCVVESADLAWEEIGAAARRHAAERDFARAERLEAEAAKLRARHEVLA